tara:strand:- start:598 stop:777 length:180 start_codon:yes stop_codon:yes gene_type:complete
MAAVVNGEPAAGIAAWQARLLAHKAKATIRPLVGDIIFIIDLKKRVLQWGQQRLAPNIK